MFIELHDTVPIVININNIQAFWYDEELECTCIAMNDNHEFRVKESYQTVVDILKKALSYR